jgi:hypothetical protein
VPVRTLKDRNPALRADAGPGQNKNEPFFHCNLFYRKDAKVAKEIRNSPQRTQKKIRS